MIIFFAALVYASINAVATEFSRTIDNNCKWDIHNCGHAETLCKPEESVYLDAKGPKSDDVDH